MRRNPGIFITLPPNVYSGMKKCNTLVFCSTLFFLLLSVSGLFGQRKHIDPAERELLSLEVVNYPCPGTATFTEDFEGGLPSGWTILDIDGNTPRPQTNLNPGWQIITDYLDTSNTAIASASWYTLPDSSDDWLIMSQMTLGQNTCFSWNAYGADPLYGEKYELRISTTTPDTAGFFAEPALVTVEAETGNETFRSVNLQDYAGQTVYLAFRHTTYNGFILVLDDFKTSENGAALDIGVDSLTTIEAMDSVVWQFSGAVRNYGTDTLDAFDLSYSIDGGPAKTEVFDTIIFPPNYGFFFLHDSLYLPDGPGTHTICIWSENPNLSPDQNLSNDTLCVNFTVSPFVAIDPMVELDRQFRVWPNPTQSLLYVDSELQGGEEWALTLLSLAGRELNTTSLQPGKPAILDMDRLPAGLYLLRIQGAGGTVFRKVLKQ